MKIEKCVICGNTRPVYKYGGNGPMCYYCTEQIPEQIKLVLKIPRNSLCPCGSGKKYKYCCLFK